MKKGLFFVAAAFCMVAMVNAQPRAIGGRLGTGIEASYQHSLGEKNMVEIGLGMPWSVGVQAVATYDWIFNIESWKGEGQWNWYAGVGAGAGYLARDFMDGAGNWVGCGFVGLAGHVGVEYKFEKIPLVLAVDYRPTMGAAICPSGYEFTSTKSRARFYYEGLYDFAVSARYTF